MAKKFKRNGRGGSFNILESEIRNAMDNSQSNRAAARFLGVDYRTYKKYAEMYPFSVDNVKEFADFCWHSNGFRIC